MLSPTPYTPTRANAPGVVLRGSGTNASTSARKWLARVFCTRSTRGSRSGTLSAGGSPPFAPGVTGGMTTAPPGPTTTVAPGRFVPANLLRRVSRRWASSLVSRTFTSVCFKFVCTAGSPVRLWKFPAMASNLSVVALRLATVADKFLVRPPFWNSSLVWPVMPATAAVVSLRFATICRNCARFSCVVPLISAVVATTLFSAT